MQDQQYILTECQTIDDLLYTPLNSSQRIKYTCFAVSRSYIAIGSTSGSIYLFFRDPCTFYQLIPLSEGAVNLIEVSPDEKIIALSTTKGSVCLLTIKPNFKLVTVSNEHVGNQITSLCWNDNSAEVYAGDNTGKISVTVSSSFSVNGMFQSPFCSLMNLDSSIGQMNFSSTLLLISTLNRSYICDTIQEQYKQIGSKARDGEFGACFYRHDCSIDSTNSLTMEGNSNGQDISDIKTPFNEDFLPKVYCARPGSRLWEVTVGGTVVKTHQFREALAIPPSLIYKPFSAQVLLRRCHEQSWPGQSVNFSHLLVVNNKYLFSYTPTGIYIIDPEKASIILWTDEYKNINMAHTVDDKIYIMLTTGVFHVLNLSSTNSLICKLFEQQFYKECLELCKELRPKLLSSTIEDFFDTDINTLLQSDELEEVLKLIISQIKSNNNTHSIKSEADILNSEEKSDSICSNDQSQGIKIMNPHSADYEINNKIATLSLEKSEKLPNAQIKLHDLEKDSEYTNGNELMSNEVENHQNYSNRNGECDKASKLKNILSYVHTDLEFLYKTINNGLRCCKTEIQLQEIIKKSNQILDEVKNQYINANELKNYLFEVVRCAEIQYENCLLENLPAELFYNLENDDVVEFILKIFLDVNDIKLQTCTCKFPHPTFTNKISKEPKFINIGKILIGKLFKYEDKCLELCNMVPYLWKEYILLKKESSVFSDSFLKYCVQSADCQILSIVLYTLSDEQWIAVAQILEDIEKRNCLQCKKNYNNEQPSVKAYRSDWNSLIMDVLKNQGPKNTLGFLQKLIAYLPTVSIEKSTYQNIIFSKILNHHGFCDTIQLDSSVEHSSICSPQLRDHLTETMEKDIQQPINPNCFGLGPYHWGMQYSLNSATCPCCTLSLQTPVLLGDGIALFNCGHAYHVNCMNQKKISRCFLHP